MEKKNQFQERVLFERTENLKLVKVRDLRPYFIVSLLVNIVIIASSFDNNQKTYIKANIIDNNLNLLVSWYKKFPDSTNEQSLGFLLYGTKETIKDREGLLQNLKQNESQNKNAIGETADEIERFKIAEKLLIDIYSDVKPDEDLVAYLDSGNLIASGSFDEVRSLVPDFDAQAKLMGL